MNRLLYLVKRLLLGLPVLLFGLTMVFLIVYVFSPINPALQVLGRDATQTDVRQLEIAMNIRYPNGQPVPLWDKYWQFLVDMLTFDLGQSWVVQRPRPVWGLIMDRMPATIWLGFWSVVIALLFGIPIGFYAGLKNNTWSDYTASAGGIVWRAMPNFWLAVMLSGLMSGAGLLAFYRDWITPTPVVSTPDSVTNLFDVASPFAGVPVLDMVGIPIPNIFEMGVAFKWILPAALVLGSSSMGNEVRIGRTAVVESLNAKYIETAKAKGVPPRKIISKHVGRNALLPLLPVIMGEFYLLIGGSIIVEQVFAIQGLGNLFFRAAVGSDLPVVMSIAYLFIIIQILFNITQDLLYTYIDPRIDLGDQNR